MSPRDGRQNDCLSHPPSGDPDASAAKSGLSGTSSLTPPRTSPFPLRHHLDGSYAARMPRPDVFVLGEFN